MNCAGDYCYDDFHSKCKCIETHDLNLGDFLIKPKYFNQTNQIAIRSWSGKMPLFGLPVQCSNVEQSWWVMQKALRWTVTDILVNQRNRQPINQPTHTKRPLIKLVSLYQFRSVRSFWVCTKVRSDQALESTDAVWLLKNRNCDGDCGGSSKRVGRDDTERMQFVVDSREKERAIQEGRRMRR